MDWEFVKELSGMFVTVIGGLGVFLVGMVNATLMNLTQAIGVILGADILMQHVSHHCV